MVLYSFFWLEGLAEAVLVRLEIFPDFQMGNFIPLEMGKIRLL
jgi:hypothetical protein